MIIDIHVHPIFQEAVRDMAGLTAEEAEIMSKGELTSKKVFGRSPNILSLADFQQEMAEAGLDMVAILMPAFKGILSRLRNERLANLIGMFPNKFIGFASFDPQSR